MKYTSCIHLEHGITFFSSSVLICCISSHEGGGNLLQIGDYKGELIDWDKVFENRNKMRVISKSAFKTGINNAVVRSEKFTCVEQFFVFKISSRSHVEMLFEIAFQRRNAYAEGVGDLVYVFDGGIVFIHMIKYCQKTLRNMAACLFYVVVIETVFNIGQQCEEKGCHLK